MIDRAGEKAEHVWEAMDAYLSRGHAESRQTPWPGRKSPLDVRHFERDEGADGQPLRGRLLTGYRAGRSRTDSGTAAPLTVQHASVGSLLLAPWSILLLDRQRPITEKGILVVRRGRKAKRSRSR
jgi:hypothetical protein